MSDNPETEKQVKKLLDAVERGEAGALERLVTEIYPELKKLAHFQLARERPGHTLNTTAIVHEAFVRLAGNSGTYKDKGHFLRAAATVMRHLLVDHARKRNAEKRGMGNAAITLHDERIGISDDTVAVLVLDAAINEIAAVDPKLEQIIECRFFAGLTVRETADALGMSVRSVERDWQRARGYLVTAMETRAD
jgi:RNA polymerase sigma factor (TIGR02999 family)